MTTLRTTPRRMETHSQRRPDAGNGQTPRLEGASPCRDASGREYDLASLADQFTFMVPEAILLDLGAPSRDTTIRTMVGSLAEAGAIPDSEQESIADAIIRREQLGSTGIGRGVAIPHTKHGAVDQVVAAMAFSREGIEFSSVDDRPAHLVFLIISPPNQPTDHLRALESVSRCLANRHYRVWRTDHRHVEDESS